MGGKQSKTRSSDQTKGNDGIRRMKNSSSRVVINDRNKGRSLGAGISIGSSRLNTISENKEILMPYYQVTCESLHYLTDNDKDGWEIKDTIAHLPSLSAEEEEEYNKNVIMNPITLSIDDLNVNGNLPINLSEETEFILNENQLKIVDDLLIRDHIEYGRPASISIMSITNENTVRSPASEFIESVTGKQLRFVDYSKSLLCAIPYLQHNCILFDIPYKVLENKEDKYWQKIVNYIGIAIGTLCSLIIVEDMLLLKSWLIDDYELVLHSFYDKGMVPPLIIVHNTGKITCKEHLSNFTENLMATFGGIKKSLNDSVFYLEDDKQYKHFVLVASVHDESISKTYNNQVIRQIELMITKQQSVSMPKSKSTLRQITDAITLGFLNIFSLSLRCNIIGRCYNEKVRLFIKLQKNQVDWNNVHPSYAYQTCAQYEYYHHEDKLIFLIETIISDPIVKRKSDQSVLIYPSENFQITPNWKKMEDKIELPLSNVYLDKPKYYYYSTIAILMLEFKKSYENHELNQQITLDI